jgi:hypothetical protein
VVLTLALAGCEHTPAEIHAYCDRWASQFVNRGIHENPAAYREDVISTCMALKNTPYVPQRQPQLPTIPAPAWVNASVPPEKYTRTLGRDKANCIERGYVGQAIQGEHSGDISGFALGSGAKVGGSESESYSSVPVFNEELFVACMNAAGWELAVSRPLDPGPIPLAGSEADSPTIGPAN